MALEITENNGTFFLNGNINSATSNFFRKHLESLKHLNKDFSISIDNTMVIDANEMILLKQLCKTIIMH